MITNVSASSLLENRVKTICSFAYGFAGQRAVSVFQAVTRHLSSLALTLPAGAVNVDNITAFEHSIHVMKLTIECNVPAQANERLVPIVEALSALLQSPDSDALRSTPRYLAMLSQRSGLGQ